MRSIVTGSKLFCLLIVHPRSWRCRVSSVPELHVEIAEFVDAQSPARGHHRTAAPLLHDRWSEDFGHGAQPRTIINGGHVHPVLVEIDTAPFLQGGALLAPPLLESRRFLGVCPPPRGEKGNKK